jgi:hypothetical protein
MNGFISRTVVAACLASGLAAATGCCGYYDVVDPCYPARYNYAARKEVCEARYPQVHNGHVLDQTVWNWHFEPNGDKLTPGGMDHLIYLIRRRPCPDQKIYLATAGVEEIQPGYDPKEPEKFAQARSELDAKRTLALQKFVTAYTAGRGLAFEVIVHDPAPADLAATPMGISIGKWYAVFQGALPGTQAGGAAVRGAGGAGAPQ